MSFRYRRLWVAVVARSVSFLGNGVADVALVLRLQPHGAALVAAVLACNLLPIALLSGVVGRLVDAADERTLLVAAGVAQAIVCSALAFATAPAVILAAVTLLGAGQAVSAATWQAVLPALAPQGRLAWALSRAQAGMTLAGIAAPAVGGVLVASFGSSVPLLVDAASFLALAVAGLLIGTVRVRSDEHDDRTGGLALVRRSPVLRVTVTVMTTVILLGSVANVAEVFLVRTTLHSSAAAFGVVGAAYSVGALAGSLWAGRMATPAAQARTLTGSMVAIGVGLATMGLAPSVAWLVVASALTGVTNGVLSVTAASLLLGATPPGQRGRVGAVQNGIFSGAQLVAYASSAALATVLDPRAIFVLGGLLAALVPVVLGTRLLRAVDAQVDPLDVVAVVAAARLAVATTTATMSAWRVDQRRTGDLDLSKAMREVSLLRIATPH